MFEVREVDIVLDEHSICLHTHLLVVLLHLIDEVVRFPRHLLEIEEALHQVVDLLRYDGLPTVGCTVLRRERLRQWITRCDILRTLEHPTHVDYVDLTHAETDLHRQLYVLQNVCVVQCGLCIQRPLYCRLTERLQLLLYGLRGIVRWRRPNYDHGIAGELEYVATAAANALD